MKLEQTNYVREALLRIMSIAKESRFRNEKTRVAMTTIFWTAQSVLELPFTDNEEYADYGAAGVATVKKYEVRNMIAGRCNLVATFTDPRIACEYAKALAAQAESGVADE